MVTRRLIKSRIYWRLWIFASVIFLGSLLSFLELQGIKTGSSGDMICGGDIVCEGNFSIDVPTKVTNYLGEIANISELCFDKNLQVTVDKPNDVQNLTLYKADRRFREDNPARWKRFNFNETCRTINGIYKKGLESGVTHYFKVNATKDKRSLIKWSVNGTNIDPQWLPIPKQVRIAEAGGLEWNFEVVQEDSDVNTDISIINSSVLEITVSAKRVLAGNYKWDMALCNQGLSELKYMNEDAQGGFDNSFPINVNYGNVTNYGMPNTWCNQTSNMGYVLFSGGSRNQLPAHFRLIFPPFNSTRFVIYTGSGTQVIIGTASLTGMIYSFQEKIVRNSTNSAFILYEDNADDIRAYKSDDNATWTQDLEMYQGTTVTSVSLVVGSDDYLYGFWTDSSDIWFANRTPAGIWVNTSIFLNTNRDNFTVVSSAIDGNNTIHACIATSGFNASINNDWLIYTNYTPTQGWWNDGSVQGGGNTWNGTWVNTNAAADTDWCDIEVDSQNNVYILGLGSDLFDVIIYSSKNGFRPNGTVSVGTFGRQSITVNPLTDMLYVTHEENAASLFFNNQTSANWNSTWTKYNIDNKASMRNTHIKTSFDGNVFIIYENLSAEKQIFLANSTVNATVPANWTNHTVLKANSGRWTNDSVPTMRGSTFPSFNRITDVIEYIYWNDTDNSLYYDQFSIPYNPPTEAEVGNNTCQSYSGTGDYNIGSCNCTVLQNIDLADNWLTANGTGRLYIFGNITNANVRSFGGCNITVSTSKGGSIR